MKDDNPSPTAMIFLQTSKIKVSTSKVMLSKYNIKQATQRTQTSEYAYLLFVLSAIILARIPKILCTETPVYIILVSTILPSKCSFKPPREFCNLIKIADKYLEGFTIRCTDPHHLFIKCLLKKCFIHS